MIVSNIKFLLEAKQEFEDTGDPAILKRISRYDNIQMPKKISLNPALLNIITTFVILISWSLQHHNVLSYLYDGLESYQHILTRF